MAIEDYGPSTTGSPRPTKGSRIAPKTLDKISNGGQSRPPKNAHKEYTYKQGKKCSQCSQRIPDGKTIIETRLCSKGLCRDCLEVAMISEEVVVIADNGSAIPTEAPPGSPKKIAVMRKRCSLGIPLFILGDLIGS
jgi:hypothetical protein